MIKQQISPWTIYDQSGNKVHHREQQQQKAQKPAVKPALVNRLAKKSGQDRQARLNDLLTDIAGEKGKLNQKINMLTSLKIIRNHLCEEMSPISQIKLYLPKIKEQQLHTEPQIKKNRPKHHYYSQKINLLHDIQAQALEDFSKIFISASLNPSPSQSISVKPQFPKIRKNNSVLLPQLDTKKQFDDNSIMEVLQSAKQGNYRKRVAMSTLIYDYPV